MALWAWSSRVLVTGICNACAVGYPSCGSDVIGKVAEPLPQGKHPQALALARSVQQSMELRA